MIWTIAYSALLVVSLLSLVPHQSFIFQVPKYFLIQLSALLLIFLGLHLLYFIEDHPVDYLLISASVVFLVVTIRKIIPHTPLGSKEVIFKSSAIETVSLIVFNVYQYNNDYKKTAEMINRLRPDIFVGIEVDEEWTEKLYDLLDRDLTKYSRIRPRQDTYGMSVFSSIPIKQSTVHYIYNGRPAMELDLTIQNEIMKLFVVHPLPPVPGESLTSKPRDKELKELGENIRDLNADYPVIVTGDFNDTGWSSAIKEFLHISGLKDPSKGRWPIITFPTFFPLLGAPIDQVFVSTDVSILQMKRLSNVGSDHFPLYVEFSL